MTDHPPYDGETMRAHAGPGRLRVGPWLPPPDGSDAEGATILMRSVPDRPERSIAPIDDEEKYRGRRRADELRQRFPFRFMIVGLIGVTMLAVGLRLATGGGAPREDAPTIAGLDTLPASMEVIPAGPPSDGPSGSPAPSTTRSTAPAASRSAGRPPAGPAPEPGSASASTPPPPAGSLVGAGGLCVEVPGNTNADNTPLRLATCSGSDAQRWSRDANRLRVLGKCMDVRSSGTDNGTVVQLYNCNTSNAQQWEIRSDNQFRNPQSNKCLTIDGATAAGTGLVIRDCTAASGQIWRLV